jgi:hypothetical protein
MSGEKTVYGLRIAAPRRTFALVPLLLWRFAAPVLAALIALDLAVFAALNGFFGACYGAFAWFGVC